MLISSLEATGVPTRRSVADFLGVLFLLLDQHEVRYCVLHSWHELPEELSSDLDLAVHPQDAHKVQMVIRRLDEQGYLPVQMVNYAVEGYRWDFAWFNSSGVVFAGLDITYQFRQGGLILMGGAALVMNRRAYKCLWVSSAANEFRYLLAKKACRGSISEMQQQRLKKLAKELGPNEAGTIATELFGKAYSSKVLQACAQGNLPVLLKELKGQLWRKTLVRDPLNPIRNLVGNSWRLLRRCFQSTGLFLTILGPDGAGKSTVISQVTEAIKPAFRGRQLFHWRPMLIHPVKSEGPVTNPHGKAPRGWAASIAVLSVLILDYWLGYLFVIWPLLVRNRLVVFDRYFHDLLVDPLRYRYGGPRWLAERLSSPARPGDALFIIVDAEEEVIRSRKCEVPAAELRRQRKSYEQLATKLHGHLVKTDVCVEETVDEVSRQVVQHMVRRFRRQHYRSLICEQQGPKYHSGGRIHV
jgi:thymidylate kinase